MAEPAVVARFLDYLRGRRYSPRTVEAYGDDLRHLAELAGATALETLAPHDIRRALASLHARGQSAGSLARILSGWRAFYRHLAREGLVEANPCTGIRPPKGPKRLPHTLAPDTLAKLLDGVPDTPLASQDRAMFELMYSSGLRLAELVGLDLTSVDRASGEVRVLGKGSKERIVPVGSRALAALADWLAVRGAVAKDATALFVGARGARISPRVVQARLNALARRQGIDQHVHPHALRHSFASHVLQSSGDLRAVQEMLGHASLSTTQVYTHLDFQHLAKVYDQAHPRAKKK
ncbi:tyrosine recombinase XerC [Parasulfuritortus cantonensis]|uniref:Tyrosine recombinase XerC n=1 Tax=Parasulfuritortus cantonensis TaxID=2528202 RepID=A0A4R1B8U8_9PROT|nr:tyrosine recombinase XerC [Parasulfuritortus cantonensis]TCJ12803.1 tyrosine recombinase XerC [Parasulfuritortus cantonensis]